MSVNPDRANLQPESWNDLFDFLDPRRASKSEAERDALASARCAELRRKLECYFSARGCPEAEDLAVETLLRVAGRCREVDSAGFGDPTGYFYGVARNVLHEWRRRAAADETGREAVRKELLRMPLPAQEAWTDTELVHRCLAHCLSTLGGRAGRLLLNYYAESGSAKIARHRALADEAGKSVNSLRIEVHRLRKALRECLFERLRNVPTSSDI
jgi:DNA-directed RNA polymerase specialized sigma24 family protein